MKMSYENAEPKILKTLNSSGQVLNDSGEVISDTSDYWVKVYNEAEPKVDKILHSDGTITDSAGNLIQDTTSFNVKKYNQAEPIPAKYLHSDGSISENPMDDNKVYAWVDSNDAVVYFNFKKAPEDEDAFEDSKTLIIDFDTKLNSISIVKSSSISGYESYVKNSNSEFELSINGVTETYTREHTKDFELWKI